VYVSSDDGTAWWRLQGNLPVVPIHDLAVKDDDLVLATHGRSFWVLDDITPLREWQAISAAESAKLFAPRTFVRIRSNSGFPRPPIAGINHRTHPPAVIVFEPATDKATGAPSETLLESGENSPDGVLVQFWLRKVPDVTTLTFLDAQGREIRSFSSEQ